LKNRHKDLQAVRDELGAKPAKDQAEHAKLQAKYKTLERMAR